VTIAARSPRAERADEPTGDRVADSGRVGDRPRLVVPSSRLSASSRATGANGITRSSDSSGTPLFSQRPIAKRARSSAPDARRSRVQRGGWASTARRRSHPREVLERARRGAYTSARGDRPTRRAPRSAQAWSWWGRTGPPRGPRARGRSQAGRSTERWRLATRFATTDRARRGRARDAGGDKRAPRSRRARQRGERPCATDEAWRAACTTGGLGRERRARRRRAGIGSRHERAAAAAPIVGDTPHNNLRMSPRRWRIARLPCNGARRSG
jgi:hypothetical protein